MALTSLCMLHSFQIAKSADVPSTSTQTHAQLRRRLCKAYIETDRNLAAEEVASPVTTSPSTSFTSLYCTHLLLMHPQSSTPKNDLIVGISKQQHPDKEVFRCPLCILDSKLCRAKGQAKSTPKVRCTLEGCALVSWIQVH